RSREDRDGDEVECSSGEDPGEHRRSPEPQDQRDTDLRDPEAARDAPAAAGQQPRAERLHIVARPSPSVRLRLPIAAVCVVGIAIAAYLTYIHYSHTAPICTTGGCEKVQKSKYAELAGIPVALLGLLAYVTLFGLAFVRGVNAATAGVFVAAGGVVFSGYLLWAQLGPIGAIC